MYIIITEGSVNGGFCTEINSVHPLPLMATQC